MNTKLTLKLNKGAIERAKRYARKNKQSLSALVENYFNLISEEEKAQGIEISPTVKELSGIVNLGKDFDSRKDYRKYIMEKYG
jgi:hypothetical protein